MKTKTFLLLPITFLLAIFVSGCTIPGFGEFCIPGFGTCGGTVEYENDVLVIRTLDAVPSTVSTGQQFRLSAWIENRGSETVPQRNLYGRAKDQKISIVLYDYCEGLFKDIKVSCLEKEDKITAGGKEVGCNISRILPKQTIPISWTLVANDEKTIPLQTSCTLKVYVRYPYETDSITSITFIVYFEMQRMIAEGKFSTVSSYITEGYGPIKPYLTAEDTQPIPVQNGQASTTAIGFQVKNKGSGFPVYSDIIMVIETNRQNSEIEIQPREKQTGQAYDIGKLIFDNLTERLKPSNKMQFIGKETPKEIFPIKTPWEINLPKTATYHITTSVDYLYEFRKEIKVTIKPPKVFG